jgi:hypothetical protein
MVATIVGHLDELRTQAFVDEEFRHAVAGMRRFLEAVSGQQFRCYG